MVIVYFSLLCLWMLIGDRYIGELFRDRQVLDYITVDRTNPNALAFGFLYLIFPLRTVQALTPAHLDSLYTRFILQNPLEAYHRAYWDGLRHASANLDNELLRTTILAQIQRTEWRKLHFAHVDPANNAVIFIVQACVDAATKEYVNSEEIYDATTLVRTLRDLLRGIYAHDLDDAPFRAGVTDLAVRVFVYHPMNGVDRLELADELFESARTGNLEERGGDLHLLRALLQTDTTTEWVVDWNRDECISRLCHVSPSPCLPEVLLSDLSSWKDRQYVLGMELANRSPQIEYRIQFLLNVLAADRKVEGGYVFPRKVLDEFWDKALTRREPGGYADWWGGDAVTDSMRQIWFGMLALTDFRRHSGLVGLSFLWVVC